MDLPLEDAFNGTMRLSMTRDGQNRCGRRAIRPRRRRLARRIAGEGEPGADGGRPATCIS
jgi:hypothetical protein